MTVCGKGSIMTEVKDGKLAPGGAIISTLSHCLER